MSQARYEQHVPFVKVSDGGDPVSNRGNFYIFKVDEPGLTTCAPIVYVPIDHWQQFFRCEPQVGQCIRVTIEPSPNQPKVQHKGTVGLDEESGLQIFKGTHTGPL